VQATGRVLPISDAKYLSTKVLKYVLKYFRKLVLSTYI